MLGEFKGVGSLQVFPREHVFRIEHLMGDRDKYYHEEQLHQKCSKVWIVIGAHSLLELSNSAEQSTS